MRFCLSTTWRRSKPVINQAHHFWERFQKRTRRFTNLKNLRYVSKVFEVPEAKPFKEHFEKVSISVWFWGHENHISEVKHDVYDKRQTAKMEPLPSLFSCVYSRVKLFVFVMNSRRRRSISVCFIYGLEEKNSKSKVIFAVCRPPLTPCLTISTAFEGTLLAFCSSNF